MDVARGSNYELEINRMSHGQELIHDPVTFTFMCSST